jgi:hypothetical protein
LRTKIKKKQKEENVMMKGIKREKKRKESWRNGKRKLKRIRSKKKLKNTKNGETCSPSM